jgi:hypothetical protein
MPLSGIPRLASRRAAEGRRVEEGEGMKFDLAKFSLMVNMLAPVVLLTVPKGDKIAPLSTSITAGIIAAEQIKGATGAEKKAHVLELVAAGVATANATGKVKLDQDEAVAVAGVVIDRVIGSVHAVEGGTVTKPAA